MSVVTISRGSFSGGKLLAECLAAKLGYRCIDRDVIVERAAAHGVSQSELRDALQKPPSFLERFQHKKYVYLALIQAALAEEVQDGRTIYHGNAGHLLLRGGGPVLRVRIVAPMEYRIAMCRERLKLNREEAVAYIHHMDQDRRRWTQYLYGVDWGDPSLYDIVINLENLDITDACEVVALLAKQQKCFEFGPRCQQSMRNLVVASRVKADLAIHPATSDLEVEVTADGGRVWIKGRVSSTSQIPEIEKVARRVAGVTEVNLDAIGAMIPS